MTLDTSPFRYITHVELDERTGMIRLTVGLSGTADHAPSHEQAEEAGRELVEAHRRLVNVMTLANACQTVFGASPVEIDSANAHRRLTELATRYGQASS